MTGFNNGVFQDLSEISIPVTSLSVNRGYGAFEFFEVIRRKPFYGDRHFARFANTLSILKLTTEFQGRLPELTDTLIGYHQADHFYIKLFALPHTPSANGFYQAALYIFPTQMPLYDATLYEEGARLVTKNFQRFLPEAKSTNYLAGQYWMDELTDSRVVDVLYHNGKSVQESSRGNLFAVKGGNVITPGKNILKGVTRSLALEILEAQQIPHTESELSLDALFSADEVFLSSTTKHILPITRIDGSVIGNGKPGVISQKVMTEFQRLKEQFT
ncbi:aminotransferase class IV [Gaoshiqia sp. Z1-71]|uniref:aminotransferase class IV n=1 Tax=Gaoshiqia hydrogeniformans TaxID=3290090 RepID=UPI003BF7A689